MKLNFSVTLIAFTCLCTSILVSPYAVVAGTGTPVKKEKEGSSRKNHAVKIYPDAFKRVMHVVARENDGKEIDFFVFDLQGTMLKHFKMESGDHEKMENMPRGNYVFSVFAGDEETAAGQFEVR